jgi:hypothetical protein
MQGYVNLFGSWFIHRHHLLLIILYDHLWWMILQSTGHAQPLSGHCSDSFVPVRKHVLLFAGQKFRLGSHHPDIFTNYNVTAFLINLQSLPKILRCMLVLGPGRNCLWSIGSLWCVFLVSTAVVLYLLMHFEFLMPFLLCTSDAPVI